MMCRTSPSPSTLQPCGVFVDIMAQIFSSARIFRVHVSFFLLTSCSNLPALSLFVYYTRRSFQYQRIPYRAPVLFPSFTLYVCTYPRALNNTQRHEASSHPVTNRSQYILLLPNMSSSTSNQVLHPTNPVLVKDTNVPRERGQTRVISDGSLLYREPLTDKEGG